MRFLLIDDHPLVRNSLQQVLRHHFDGCIVEEAASAGEAMAKLPAGPWNAVLLDIDLPDRSGVDLLRDVKDLAPGAPVLVLSGLCEEEFGHRALKAGAAGFVPKASPTEEIITAIGRILEGRKYISADLAEKLLGEALTGGTQAPHQSLSDREFEVLRLLGRGRSVSQIAVELGLSVKTVSTYRSRILEKLGASSTAELIRYAVEHRIMQ
jgi:two-component system invasion response regulator UvrY